MTRAEYASLSYEQKLHVPAAKYQKMIEADHRDYRSRMARMEKYNTWMRCAILCLYGALGLILLSMAGSAIWSS